MSKKKKKDTVEEEVQESKEPGYVVPEKYRNQPITVRLGGQWVALGGKVIRHGKPPQLTAIVPEATEKQYLELAKAGRYGIELKA